MNWISSLGVAGEVVDGHHHRQAEAVDILDVLLEVLHALVEGLDVGFAEILHRHAAVELQGADRGHDHHGVGLDARVAALDVQELLRPRSAPKPASVTVYSESRIESLVASTLLQP